MSPRKEFGAGGGGNGKGTSSSWGWQVAAGWGVLGPDLTQMRRKARIDTVDLQWREGRGTRSGEKHTAGLWELLVGPGKRGLCQNEG